MLGDMSGLVQWVAWCDGCLGDMGVVDGWESAIMHHVILVRVSEDGDETLTKRCPHSTSVHLPVPLYCNYFCLTQAVSLCG